MTSRALIDALHEIGDRLAQAPHLLLCLDFDGTLTPLADHPDEVELSPETRRLLRLLARCANVSLAIVSGRERTDLQQRVDVPGAIYAGNHGLEISGPGLYFVEPTVEMFGEPLRELAADLKARLAAVPEALVEEKHLTLSVHYRCVPPERWEEVDRLVHAALANANHSFLLDRGKRTHEIRPHVYWNRGHTVKWLLEHLDEESVLPLYVGDDPTDEDAFAAIPDGVTVKVGESPGSVAQYHLNGPDEVREFLAWLAGRVSEHRQPQLH